MWIVLKLIIIMLLTSMMVCAGLTQWCSPPVSVLQGRGTVPVAVPVPPPVTITTDLLSARNSVLKVNC